MKCNYNANVLGILSSNAQNEKKNPEDETENISYMFGMQFNIILNCFSINLQM